MNTSVKFSDSENDYFYDLWQRIMKTANVLFYSATCDIYAIWRYIRSAIRQHVKISITCYTVTLSIYVCSKKAITQFLNHEQKLCWALVRTGRFMTLLPAGLRVAQPCRYCFYSMVQKWVFRPAVHVTPINVKFGTGERSAGSLPRAKFHVHRGENVGIQPPKLSKFRILARNLYLRGDSFAIFLRNSQYLYASIGSF